MTAAGGPIDEEWRSYVDDDDQEEFEIPDVFASPPPDPRTND